MLPKAEVDCEMRSSGFMEKLHAIWHCVDPARFVSRVAVAFVAAVLRPLLSVAGPTAGHRANRAVALAVHLRFLSRSLVVYALQVLFSSLR